MRPFVTIGVHFNLLTLSTILSTDKSCILKFHVVVIFCRWFFHDLKMVFLRLLRILFVDDLPNLKTTKCRLTPSNQSTNYIRNQSGCQPSACRSRGFPQRDKKEGAVAFRRATAIYGRRYLQMSAIYSVGTV